MCYGKLGRWDEAIAAYLRLELDVKSEQATGHVLNALEALVVAEKPEQLLSLVEKVGSNGWTLPKPGPNADKFISLFHGFPAMVKSPMMPKTPPRPSARCERSRASRASRPKAGPGTS